jgi:hypothetical protein
MPKSVNGFHSVKPGEWFQPDMKGHLQACCDCGLVHRMNFRVGKDNKGKEKIQFQMFRAVKETKELRAKMK